MPCYLMAMVSMSGGKGVHMLLIRSAQVQKEGMVSVNVLSSSEGMRRY